VLSDAALRPSDVAHVASTGSREQALLHVGHFYPRLSLAFGARYLFPNATATLDVGARQIRCTRFAPNASGRRYAATPKATCGGGELVEVIARRSGVGVDAAAQLPGVATAYDDL
jgi:activator of 2-hydroxyglutaryl-CoA dehydratase